MKQHEAMQNAQFSCHRSVHAPNEAINEARKRSRYHVDNNIDHTNLLNPFTSSSHYQRSRICERLGMLCAYPPESPYA
jgi:hypothetical protein